ncbi:MAG: hypothetical protein ACTSVZ_09905 [Promethearchaeota archaeon]
MSNISVRIDSTLKKEMEKLSHLNWSEIIRIAIKDTIRHTNEQNLAKAVLLNEKVRKEAPIDFDSTKIIQKFRAERK